MVQERSANVTRTNNGWLSPAEHRALEWLGPRTPLWLTPNRLTATGLGAAFLALGGYALAAREPAWLWFVNAALVVNWLGDSLDGLVARLRGIERPRYGFFLDQSVDVVSQLLFALGLAASGYLMPELVMLGLAAYLMMTVQGLLRAQTTGVFPLATGGMGLTEVRCLFVLGNSLFYFAPPSPFAVGALTVKYSDLLAIVWIASNLSLYVWTMAAVLRQIDRDESPHTSGRSTDERF
jgi:archaetidylinositol phosphate synthase